MSEAPRTPDLAHELRELRQRLRESEETLGAIQTGDVDALVVGNEIYTLDSSHAAANRLRQDVLAQMQDAVIACDADDRLIFMNPAAERQYGMTASQSLGHDRAEVFTVEWPDAGGEQAMRETLRSEGVFRGASVHRRVDGSRLHVESTVSRLCNADGSRDGYLHVIRDITARVQAEQSLQAAATELREADRKKDEFIATLAHELRNPLAPIRNALEIMRLSTAPGVHENARNIVERQLNQMVHLVDDLLDVSRISSGKLELRLEKADIAAVVQSAVETSRPLIQAGRHQLTLNLPAAGSLVVSGDVTRLCQMVSNLINNAAKYTPEGGRIEVTASRLDGQAVIVVKDTGIGIPAGMLQRVFEMFAQVDQTAGRSQGGLGIGLALVKRFAEMHGGSVEGFSAGPGSGSTFSLRLPLSSSPAGRPAGASHLLAQGMAPEQRRVLVVDDNADSADSLSELMQMLGYETRVTHDGAEALRLARTFRPAVAVLDIGLPHIDGREVARRIRSEPWGEQMLIIALSGWGQQQDRVLSAQAGFDHHLVKPVDIELLMNVVKRGRAARRATACGSAD